MPRRKRDGEIITRGVDEYAARGHISREAFQAAVRAYMDDDAIVVIGQVRHGWWRFIPSNWPEEGMIGAYIDAAPGAQGAFRVTTGDTR